MNLLTIRNEVLANGFDPVRMTGRINQYINDGMYEIARRVNYYAEESQETVVTSAGSNLIPFPSDLARVRSLRDTDLNRQLSYVGLSEIDQSNQGTQGRPMYWALDGANLHLYPTPNGVFNLALRYWALPPLLALDADVPSLPTDYHNMLVIYAIFRCYLAEDDEQTGKFYSDMFEKQLGMFHTDVVFPTTEEPHQARGMWDEPRSLPGGNTWTWFG